MENIKTTAKYKGTFKVTELKKVFLKMYWSDKELNKIKTVSWNSFVWLYIERFWAYQFKIRIYLKTDNEERLLMEDWIDSFIPLYSAKKENWIKVKLGTFQSYDLSSTNVKLCCTIIDGFNWFYKEGIIDEIIVKNKCLCNRHITLEELIKIGIKESIAGDYIDALNQTFVEYNINTCIRKVHFLAQIMHESGNLKYTSELGASNSDYNGFKGRGLIQITTKENYKAYEKYINEDVTSSLECKMKLEKPPHSVRSAGWFWTIKASLNQYADDNDFMNITRIINGGFNGYNDRLQKLKFIIKSIASDCDLDITTDYDFKKSRIYNNAISSFAWGLWHDSACKKRGCNYDVKEAICGYERCIELNPQKFNLYGIQNMEVFSEIRTFGQDKRPKVSLVEASKLRLQNLKKELK